MPTNVLLCFQYARWRPLRASFKTLIIDLDYRNLMKMPFAFLLMLLSLWSLEAITPVRSRPADYCNRFIFNCVNERQSFMTWDVFNGSISIYSVTVTLFSGQQRREVPPLIITVDIIYINSSAIASTMTIDGVKPHSFINVACNDDAVQEVVPNINFTLFPSYLLLIPDFQCLGLSIFNMTWENITQEDSTSYLVNISPSDSIITRSLHGNDPSVQSITLSNNIQYNFTLSLEDCSNILNATYALGGCLALMDSSHVSVLKLNIYLSGEVTGEIKCNNDQSFIVCTENGEWNYSITDICNSNSQNDSESYSTIMSDMEIASTIYATEQIDNQDCDQAATISIPILISSVIGSNLLTLVIGILSGLLIGFKLSLKKTLDKTTPAGEREVNSSVSTPLYEEIKLTHVPQDVKMSQNDAYCVLTQ